MEFPIDLTRAPANRSKTVKPFFTDKVQIKSKITLIEKHATSDDANENEILEEVISKENEISEVFNNFFINIVPNLNISAKVGLNENFIETNDPVSNAISKFCNHPSISMIKDKNRTSNKFSFCDVTFDEVLEKVNHLKANKSSQQNDIPTNILKSNASFFAEYFSKNINYCIGQSKLPADLKLAASNSVVAYQLAVDFLTSELLLPSISYLPYALQLTYLVEYFNLNPTPDIHERMELKNWFWKTSFTGHFGRANTGLITRNLAYIRKFATKEIDKVPVEEKINFKGFYCY